MIKKNTIKIAIGLLALIIGVSIFSQLSKTTSTTSTIRTCGKEGHFSHSSGGGKFSWNAIRLSSLQGLSSPYLFIMFEKYIDGTTDHYVVGTIDLPTMSAELITEHGEMGVLNKDNFTVSTPDPNALQIIHKAQKQFFDMLPCYSGSYAGQGTQ
jgi:hypothetical protein